MHQAFLQEQDFLWMEDNSRLVAERNEPIKEWRDDGCPTTESKFCVQGFVDSPQCYPSENHASMLVLVIVLHI